MTSVGRAGRDRRHHRFDVRPGASRRRFTVGVAAISLVTCLLVSAGTASAEVIRVGTGTYGVAVDPTTHNVYVTNFVGPDVLSVIDGSGDARSGTVTANIAVGDEPFSVAVDPTNHNVYVSNMGGKTVSVIDESGDAHHGTVTATIPIGSYLNGIAVDPVTHDVYVGTFDGTVAVIDESGDAHTGTVTAQIPVGGYPFAWRSIRLPTTSTCRTTPTAPCR